MIPWTSYNQEAPLDLSTKKHINITCELQNPDPSPLQRWHGPFMAQPPYEYTLYSGCSLTAPSLSYPTNNNIGIIEPRPIPARSSSYAPSPPTSPDYEDFALNKEYAAFERNQLNAIAERNGGSLVGNNPRMRRAVHTNEKADESYRSHREKNNYAAKQSRDRRKMRQISLSIKVAYLSKKLTDLKTAVGVCDECRHPRK